MKTTNLLTEKLHSVLFLLIVTVILASATVTKSNAQSANFSGKWVLNESKSSPAEGGFRFAPGTMVITHNGNELSVQSSMPGPEGDMTTNAKYTLDGKECSNTIFMDNVRKSVVQKSSDGKTLTFTHTMDFGGNEFKTTEIWKLNEADKTLVVETSLNTPNGEMKTTNVYDKK